MSSDDELLAVVQVNYSPGFLPEAEVNAMLNATWDEYAALKAALNYTTFYEVIRHFLPRSDIQGHPAKAIVYRVPHPPFPSLPTAGAELREAPLEKPTNSYMELTAEENWLITYVEDLYLYNAICHAIDLLPDSVRSTPA